MLSLYKTIFYYGFILDFWSAFVHLWRAWKSDWIFMVRKIKIHYLLNLSVVFSCRMVTDYVNALQGILIFILLVVTRKRALKGLARRGLCCIKLPASWNALHDDESIIDDIDDDEVTRLSNNEKVWFVCWEIKKNTQVVFTPKKCHTENLIRKTEMCLYTCFLCC